MNRSHLYPRNDKLHGEDINAARVVNIINNISPQTDDFRVAIAAFKDFPYEAYGSS